MKALTLFIIAAVGLAFEVHVGAFNAVAQLLGALDAQPALGTAGYQAGATTGTDYTIPGILILVGIGMLIGAARAKSASMAFLMSIGGAGCVALGYAILEGIV